MFAELPSLFEESGERLPENECQLAVCQTLIRTNQVPLCGNGEKAFCFSGCTFEMLKICLQKLTGCSCHLLTPAFHFYWRFSSVCSPDVAAGFTCAGLGEAALFLPLHVQLGASWGRSVVLPPARPAGNKKGGAVCKPVWARRFPSWLQSACYCVEVAIRIRAESFFWGNSGGFETENLSFSLAKPIDRGRGFFVWF